MTVNSASRPSPSNLEEPDKADRVRRFKNRLEQYRKQPGDYIKPPRPPMTQQDPTRLGQR